MMLMVTKSKKKKKKSVIEIKRNKNCEKRKKFKMLPWKIAEINMFVELLTWLKQKCKNKLKLNRNIKK